MAARSMKARPRAGSCCCGRSTETMKCTYEEMRDPVNLATLAHILGLLAE
jgi:hypothetical protein